MARPFRHLTFLVVFLSAFSGCLGATAPPQHGPAGRFAVFEATDNITVTGPAIDRPTTCGRPVYPYARIDLENQTLQVVRGNHSLRLVAPAHLLFEHFQFVDVAESCPRLTWLFPLLKEDTRLIVDIHTQPFLLNMTRGPDEVRWEGRVVEPGDTVERVVDFRRELGGRNYHYFGTIRFTFHGLWSLDDVEEVDSEAQLSEGSEYPYWHHPPTGAYLHYEG